ncbi:MAG: RHS repeat protein [Pirellulaceae bacterium]|nr:RHS repeat protein [Pirellulaceae bacterium]
MSWPLTSRSGGHGRLVTITDRNGNLTVNGYDGNGRLASLTDPDGASRSFIYGWPRQTGN